MTTQVPPDEMSPLRDWVDHLIGDGKRDNIIVPMSLARELQALLRACLKLPSVLPEQLVENVTETPDELAKQLVYDMECLRHMVGIRQGTHKRDYGYRNYFNSTSSGPDYESMQRLVAIGLVRPGHRNYWHATEAGCKAVGLNEKQTRRALNGD